MTTKHSVATVAVVVAGWQFVGPLCEDPSSHMWECPIMAHLSSVPLSPDHQQLQQQRGRHMLSVSPDYCVNMIQYWLGDYAEGRFDLEVRGSHLGF
jgi:sucrose-6-phosphate hydrolase SacC (GH32 family)